MNIKNITKPISCTIQERVSSYYYRISLLKMQIRSSCLSGSCAQDSQVMSGESHQSYQLELETWLVDWKAEVISAIKTDQPCESQLLSVLEAWAELQYHHTAMLTSCLFRAGDGVLVHCDQILRSCGFLARHQQKFSQPRRNVPMSEQPLVPVFPMNWTVAHLIFSTSLSVLSPRDQTMSKASERTNIAKRGLVVLALLDGNPSMLSTGFSEILEGLCDEEEVMTTRNR